MVAPLLADRYHVVAYDISGMGDSGARATYDDAIRAQELRAVAAHTGMFDTGVAPFVVAHSYGCTITFNAMERWAGEFGGAILCDLMLMHPERQAAFFAERDAGIAAASGKRPRGPSPDLAAIMARFRLEPEQPVTHPVLREYVARHSVCEVEGGWSWKFSPTIFSNMAGDDPQGRHGWWGRLAERLRDPPVRNAFVYGAKSTLFDADSVAWLREIGVARTPFIPIPHAHHHLMLDEPVAFASALRAVLEVWRSET